MGVENADPEVTQTRQSDRVSETPTQKGYNFVIPEGSRKHQSGRVPLSPIRKGLENSTDGRIRITQNLKRTYLGVENADPEVTQTRQSDRVSETPTQKGYNFVIPEGSRKHQSGRILISPI